MKEDNKVVLTFISNYLTDNSDRIDKTFLSRLDETLDVNNYYNIISTYQLFTHKKIHSCILINLVDALKEASFDELDYVAQHMTQDQNSALIYFGLKLKHYITIAN